MSEDVTTADLAAFLGISARRGISVKGGPGCWRLRESVARYCDDLRRQAKGKGGEAAAAERGRLASAQADLLALRVAKQRGEVLDTGDVAKSSRAAAMTPAQGESATPDYDLPQQDRNQGT